MQPRCLIVAIRQLAVLLGHVAPDLNVVSDAWYQLRVVVRREATSALRQRALVCDEGNPCVEATLAPTATWPCVSRRGVFQ